MKDNKLIAEFMGSKTIRINVPFEYDLGEELPTSKNICNSLADAMEEVQTEVDEGIINGCNLCMETPQYHTSWDWLMPVVDKIEIEGYDPHGLIDNALGSREIEDVHDACVTLIKAHNDERK